MPDDLRGSPYRTITARNKRDKKAREALENRLKESGEKDKLKAYLEDKLIECGWKDDLAKRCRGTRTSPKTCAAFVRFTLIRLTRERTIRA